MLKLLKLRNRGRSWVLVAPPKYAPDESELLSLKLSAKTLRLISYGSEKSGHFLKLENESNSPVFEESNFEEREKKKEGKKKKEEKKKEREEEKKEYIKRCSEEKNIDNRKDASIDALYFEVYCRISYS
ncbi:unnamed protein product [Rhizophagus irregularis]|nr:unnamed protein product [Rhizophagus irregularis]CAB5359246.1 unnamed protein product [Rhizophagus irregularis]